MTIELTLILVLVGFILFNLLGLGLYHNQWKRENKPGEWKKSFEFWSWTFWLLLFGICYVIIRFVLWIKSLINKENE